jgi:hypothetical protein
MGGKQAMRELIFRSAPRHTPSVPCRAPCHDPFLFLIRPVLLGMLLAAQSRQLSVSGYPTVTIMTVWAYFTLAGIQWAYFTF